MKCLTTMFKVEGRNADKLVNCLRRRNFTLFNVKKVGEKSLYFTVGKKDGKKVFAISKELCYNIKKIKDGGIFYPFYRLGKNLGLLFGIIFAVILIVFSNDFIFDVTYTGSGALYKSEVEQLLKENGAYKFNRFSKLDLNLLADKMLKESPKLSFVSCSKRGNTLNVNLALLNSGTDTLTGKADVLVADVNGVIESAKVYRGRAIKNVGEEVVVGDVLVDGNVLIKEQELKVNVIATYSIIAEYNFTYYSSKDGEEEYALILAQNSFKQDVIKEQVQKNFKKDEYCYKVSLFYRHVLYVG